MKGINASGVGFSSIDENEEGFDWTNVGNKSDEADATERINVHSLFIKDVDDEYFLTFACNMATISFVVLGASLPYWIKISTMEIWLLFSLAALFYIVMIIDVLRSKTMSLLKLHHKTQHSFQDVVDYVNRVKSCSIKLGAHVICYKYPHKTPTYTTSNNNGITGSAYRTPANAMYSGVADDYSAQGSNGDNNNNNNGMEDASSDNTGMMGSPEIIWDHVYEYTSFIVNDHTHFGEEEVSVLKEKALQGHRDNHKICLLLESRSHIELDSSLKDRFSAFTQRCKNMNAHRCDHVDVEMIANLEGMDKVMILNPATEMNHNSHYGSFIEILMNPYLLIASTAMCLGYMHREVLKTYTGTVDLCFQKRLMHSGSKTEEPVLVGGEQ